MMYILDDIAILCEIMWVWYARPWDLEFNVSCLSQKKMSLHPSDAWKQMAVVFGGNPRFYMLTGCSRHVILNKTPEKVPYFFHKITVCFVRMGHRHDFCCRTKPSSPCLILHTEKKLSPGQNKKDTSAWTTHCTRKICARRNSLH